MKNLQGKVTMELSEYNKMLQTILEYERAVEVNNDWGTHIRVSFNLQAFEDLIVEKTVEKYPEADFQDGAFDDWNKATTNIAELPKEDSENEK